jgi:hypothetical protein
MPWEELLSARGPGARQTALFIGRIRGKLYPKELGQPAGGIRHSAVGTAIRRLTQRFQSERTLLDKVAPRKGTKASLTPSFIVWEAACITSDSTHEKVGPWCRMLTIV